MRRPAAERAFLHEFQILAVLTVLAWLAGLTQDLLLASGLMAPSGEIWLLDADSEQSVLTWLSVLILFACSATLYVIATRVRETDLRTGVMWTLLAAVFLGLSGDEMLSIHEKIADPLKAAVHGHGFLAFAWVLAAIPVCIAGLIAAIPLLRTLSPGVRARMLLAAVIYVGGAVGMEMVGGDLMELFGPRSFAYRMEVNIEEGMECLGALLFLHTLLPLALAAPVAVRQTRRAPAAASPGVAVAAE